MRRDRQVHVLDAIDDQGTIARESLYRSGFRFCDDDVEKVAQLERSTQAVASQACLHATSFHNVIHSAVAASSTDAPEQSLDQTLGPERGFWSSGGHGDGSDCEEFCIYKLAGPACQVAYLRMVVYRAFYQHGYPIYPPIELQVFTGPTLQQLHAASPRHLVRLSAAPQVFPLYSSAPIGRYLKVVLYGKHQRQWGDEMFYIALQWMSALGTLVPSAALQRVHFALCEQPSVVSPGGNLLAQQVQQVLLRREQQQGPVVLPRSAWQGLRWRRWCHERQLKQLEERLVRLQDLRGRVVEEEVELQGVDERGHPLLQHQLLHMLDLQVQQLDVGMQQQRDCLAQLEQTRQQGFVMNDASSHALSLQLETAYREFERRCRALQHRHRSQDAAALEPSQQQEQQQQPQKPGRRSRLWHWAWGLKPGRTPPAERQEQQEDANMSAPLLAQPHHGVFTLQGAAAAAAEVSLEAPQQLPTAVGAAALDCGATHDLQGFKSWLGHFLGPELQLPQARSAVPWLFAADVRTSEVLLLTSPPSLSNMGVGEPAGARQQGSAVQELQQHLQEVVQQQAAEWQRWWQSEQGMLLLGYQRALQLLQQLLDTAAQPGSQQRLLVDAIQQLPNSWAFQMLARQLLALGTPGSDGASSGGSSSSSGGSNSSSGGSVSGVQGLLRLLHAGADVSSWLAGADMSPFTRSAGQCTAAESSTAVQSSASTVYTDSHTHITAAVHLLALTPQELPWALDEVQTAGAIQLFTLGDGANRAAVTASSDTSGSGSGGSCTGFIDLDPAGLYEEGLVADLLVQQALHQSCAAA